MSAAAVLLIEKDGSPAREFSVEGEVVLGRGEGCAVRLDDRAISREHVICSPSSGGAIQIQKKSAFSSVRLNGSDVTSAIVRPGDVIEIGPYRLRLAQQQAVAQKPPSVESAPVSTPVVSSPPSSDAPLELEIAPSESVESVSSEIQSEPLSGPLPIEELPFEVGTPEGTGLELENTSATTETPPSDSIPEFSLESSGLDSGVSDLPMDITHLVEAAEPDAATKPISKQEVVAVLQVSPGRANVEKVQVTDQEIEIGRDPGLAISLLDKKASRKHAMVFRRGARFILQDLGSANGTYLNEQRMTGERELYHDDCIRIGSTEIKFSAENAVYQARQERFLKPVEAKTKTISRLAHAPSPMGPSGHTPGLGDFGGAQTSGGFAGVAGMAPIPGTTSGKTSLLQKYRDLPPQRRVIWMAVGFALIYFGFLDEEALFWPDRKVVVAKAPVKTVQAQPSGVPGAQASGAPSASVGSAFESLTPDQKKFVQAQHEQAYQHLKNKEYDQSLFEIRKVFSLVTDYKDSKEIERYAIEGKRKLEAFEEERKKKQAEERIKQEVGALLQETQEKMDRKQYLQAQILFSEILSRDPENALVARWRAEIREVEEKKAQEARALQLREEINARAVQALASAQGVARTQGCRAAIPLYRAVSEIPATNEKPGRSAKAAIAQCAESIRAAREPLIEEATQLEQAGEFSKAFAKFKEASKIDSLDARPTQGMNRIRQILNSKAKVTYTEAVLAESFGDYQLARNKYEETLAIAPDEDVFHQRAQRKLERWKGKLDLLGPRSPAGEEQ
jgi:pSer/pThr/pTyr-binding forkhead associated (FHA) protein